MPEGPRSRARIYALLALYRTQIDGTAPTQMGRLFHEDSDWRGLLERALAGIDEDAAPPPACNFDTRLFDDLLYGVEQHSEVIDAALGDACDRAIGNIDPVERAVLRLATYELLFCPEMPIPVILNEAIDLAKTFGAEQGHRYVNGVLDRVARAARPGEGARPGAKSGRR